MGDDIERKRKINKKVGQIHLVERRVSKPLNPLLSVHVRKVTLSEPTIEIIPVEPGVDVIEEHPGITGVEIHFSYGEQPQLPAGRSRAKSKTRRTGRKGRSG